MRLRRKINSHIFRPGV